MRRLRATLSFIVPFVLLVLIGCGGGGGGTDLPTSTPDPTATPKPTTTPEPTPLDCGDIDVKQQTGALGEVNTYEFDIRFVVDGSDLGLPMRFTYCHSRDDGATCIDTNELEAGSRGPEFVAETFLFQTDVEQGDVMVFDALDEACPASKKVKIDYVAPPE